MASVSYLQTTMIGDRTYKSNGAVFPASPSVAVAHLVTVPSMALASSAIRIPYVADVLPRTLALLGALSVVGMGVDAAYATLLYMPSFKLYGLM